MALLIGGAAMIFHGMQASESVSSDFSRFFTGSPTDRTLWLLIGGLAMAAAGVAALVRGKASG